LGFLGKTPLCKIPFVAGALEKARGNTRELERFIKFALVGTLGATTAPSGPTRADVM
jgi:hypothetical protein